MTFTQTWPTEYKDQVAYMKNLLAFTQTQDANSGVCGLAQATSPTSGELLAAWQTYVGDNRAVPPGAKIQWWDTVREEERQALMKRLSKMSAAERKRFIEEERILSNARQAAVALKKQTANDLDDAALERLFGIELVPAWQIQATVKSLLFVGSVRSSRAARTAAPTSEKISEILCAASS
jgi:hypothetical protein